MTTVDCAFGHDITDTFRNRVESHSSNEEVPGMAFACETKYAIGQTNGVN